MGVSTIPVGRGGGGGGGGGEKGGVGGGGGGGSNGEGIAPRGTNEGDDSAGIPLISRMNGSVPRYTGLSIWLAQFCLTARDFKCQILVFCRVPETVISINARARACVCVCVRAQALRLHFSP